MGEKLFLLQVQGWVPPACFIPLLQKERTAGRASFFAGHLSNSPSYSKGVRKGGRE